MISEREVERMDKERPEVRAWWKSHTALREADSNLSSAIRSVENARLRFEDAVTAEREAWDKLIASRSVTLDNAVKQ